MRGATILERAKVREAELRERFLSIPRFKTALSAYRNWEPVRDFLESQKVLLTREQRVRYKRGHRARSAPQLA